MARETLIDFFQDLSPTRGEFLVHDDGYRTRRFTYGRVAVAAARFAARLRDAGLHKGDMVILWAENRPEWVAALWGCLLEGVVLVPVDFRASPDLLARVQRIVGARLVLVGDEVEPLRDLSVPVWRLAGMEWPASFDPATASGPRIERGDTAEIIFTSGATADPKGVVITHGNILANIVPVEREVRKYRRYARPLAPIRFLNLLPLSHMFGQAMGTFIPPMLPGVVVFMRGYNPGEIVHQIRSRRVSVLVSVPKILDVLRDHVLRLVPEAGTSEPRPGEHWLRRWWRYRRVHRLFGWKFWSFVVGAAPLDPDLEQFWTRLGFVVIQGYGLTETAPIVTLNHPFRTRRGSVGTPIAGVEVKIAEDGEILVRGENVTRGYYHAAEATAEAFTGGWFHTGDIGSIDEAGRLTVRGRKKEVIVTPEGLNVFPDDIERVLNAEPGVVESAAVGMTRGGEERVHAVLVLEPGTSADEVVRHANAALEDHQKIRGYSLWPATGLPRTEGTRKLKRAEIQSWVAAGGATAPQSGPAATDVGTVVARFAGSRPVANETTIDELGLSSLERLELMMALEERFRTTLDEAAFSRARSVADLRALVERPVEAAGPGESIEFPAWNRAAWARAVRRISLPTWILPLARVFAWLRVEGREHLQQVEGPVIFAANHQSHLDTPVILRALPPRWRYRVAPAMAKEFFKAHFAPAGHSRREWFTSSLNYYLAALFFNAFPLPQREAGTRRTLRYVGDLVADGFSILIYPEGHRTQAGEIAEFRPGVAMMASRLGIPIVPIRLSGLERVLHQSWRMARPGRVRVTFGRPLGPEGDDYPALARQVETAVRNLQP
jgi:long-chain acyl-CoA synthetase